MKNIIAVVLAAGQGKRSEITICHLERSRRIFEIMDDLRQNLILIDQKGLKL